MAIDINSQFVTKNKQKSLQQHFCDFVCPPLLSSPINAKKVNTTSSSDSYVGLWRNYLLLCCSATTSVTTASSSAGSVRCSPPETLASTPDSGYCIDSKVSPPPQHCQEHYRPPPKNSCFWPLEWAGAPDLPWLFVWIPQWHMSWFFCLWCAGVSAHVFLMFVPPPPISPWHFFQSSVSTSQNPRGIM